MKIVLADNQVLFRAGMVHVLRQLDHGVEIIEAGNCSEALAAVTANLDVSLVLLDLCMPDCKGLNVLDALKENHPGIGIVILSASENRQDMRQAIRKGALGFVPKTVTPAVLVGALELVLAGGVYIPAEMINEVATEVAGGDNLAPDLTRRQLDVLARAIEGKPYKLIARELKLAESTVKTHLIAAFRALGVNNRMQAAHKVRALKLQFAAG